MSKLTDSIVFSMMGIALILLLLFVFGIISEIICSTIICIFIVIVMLCIIFKNHDALHAPDEGDEK